jgi:hypothetical protein
VIIMKKCLPKSYKDCISEKYKSKTCIGCKDLTNPECGILKSIRHSSGAVYTIKVPDKDCSMYGNRDKAVTT